MPGLFDDVPLTMPAAASAAPAAKPRSLFDDVPMLAPAKPVETDPIRATVRKEIDEANARGQDTSAGAARRILQGATFNLADEALAAAGMIPEMIKRRTLNPFEGYAYAKAREDMDLEDGREKGGLLGTVAEVGGGLMSGIGLMRTGITFLPRAQAALGSGLKGTAAGLAADGAALGALTGAADANDGDRLTGAAWGGAIGGAFGGALPVAVTLAGKVAAPVVSNIRARMNPEGYAARQIGRAASDAGLSADDVAGRLADAAADGQLEYRVMDAIGLPGQRAAAVVGKNPGEGRAVLREFLEERQAGQGRRLANDLAEGFDAPQTAAQSRAAREAVRREDASVNYDRARGRAAEPVNVNPTIDRLLAELPREAPAGGSETLDLVNRIGRKLVDRQGEPLTDFATLLQSKREIDSIVSQAERAGDGNTVRIATIAKNQLDEALAGASGPYSKARDTFRLQSEAIDALDEGAAAAARGRTEDTVARFGEMRPRGYVNGNRVRGADQQQAFREGYVDPLIADVQKAAPGVNKARPLTSDAARTEIDAFAAPGRGERLGRQIDREGEMFATRNAAAGGSATFENLADDAAAGVDVGAIAKLLTGDVFGAAKDGLRLAGANLSGNTEAVRRKMSDILMSGDPAQVRTLLEAVADAAQQHRQVGQYAGRALESGGAALTAALPDSSSRGRSAARQGGN